MYPTISDLLFDLFGIHIPLPVQSFGFFVAIAFVIAYYVSVAELKRKQGLGLLHSTTRKVLRGKAATIQDYMVAGVLGGVIGFKMLDMFLQYKAFADNPQSFLLSTDGNILGLLLGAGIAVFLTWQDDKKNRLPEHKWEDVEVHPYQLMGNVITYAAIGGILGAKIFHNLENIDEFVKDPLGSLISFSGLTFYGGLIVGASAVLYYTNKNNIPAIHMVDATAPALMLSYGIGRIGCQVSGDGDWGIVNTAPKPSSLSFLPDWAWSYTYPHNVLRDGIPIPGCEGKHCFALPEAVYPTPLYEAIMAILLFFILWSLRKKIKIPGMMFAIYLMLNGLERFFIEKIRVNSVYHLFGHDITQAEIISTILFLGGLIWAVSLYRNSKKEPPLQAS